MDGQDSRKLVREFFQRFSAGDARGATDLLAHDAIWRVMGKEGGLPVSGTMNKAAVGNLIINVRQAIPSGLRLTPTGWTIDGERIAVEMESYGEMASGAIYNNLYHFLITVQEGKITGLREYMDTDQVRRLFLDA